MSDPRVKELRDEFIKYYKTRHGHEPMWAYGKNDKLVQGIWTWADKNGIDPGRIYGAILNWFSDDGFALDTKHDFGAFYKMINKYLEKVETPEQKQGRLIIEKAKEMFQASKIRIEERLKVDEKTPKDFIEYFTSRYSRDEAGCREWVKKQRQMQGLSEAMKDKQSKIYQMWVKEGKAAREYFGSDLVSKLWSLSEPVKKSLSEQIKKAKEIESII